jgi:hypothetical protein
VRSSSGAPVRVLRLGAISSSVILGLTLVMTAGAARAADDDDRPFTERFVDGFKSTIRGNNMDNRGIDYRERSPLVVPPNLDLPPPVTASKAPQITNWPKDPDERQRKAIIAAKKKNAPPVVAVAPADAAPRPINIAPPVPENVAAAVPAPPRPDNPLARDPVNDQAGDLFRGGASALVPSGVSDTLGLDKLDIGNLFGSKKAEAPALPPGTEPSREALTQPPSGYQTPSANYRYGLEPKGIFSGESNPDRNPAAQASSASSVVH